MATRGSKRSKPQGPRVNVQDQPRLRAWARYWGCSQRDIREAVKTSGVMVVDIQEWLKLNVAR